MASARSPAASAPPMIEVALCGQRGTERTPAEVSMSKYNGKATKEAANRGLRKARAWAAPQVERTGHVIQDTVAPKVAAALQSSARRIDPGPPPRRGWGKAAAGISVLLAAAAGVIVGALRKRSASSAPAGEDAAPAAGEAEASSNAEVKNPARTS